MAPNKSLNKNQRVFHITRNEFQASSFVHVTQLLTLVFVIRQLFEADLISEVSGRIFETRIFITTFTSLDPVQDDTIHTFTPHLLKIHFNSILVRKGHLSTALNRVR